MKTALIILTFLSLFYAQSLYSEPLTAGNPSDALFENCIFLSSLNFICFRDDGSISMMDVQTGSDDFSTTLDTGGSPLIEMLTEVRDFGTGFRIVARTNTSLLVYYVSPAEIDPTPLLEFTEDLGSLSVLGLKWIDDDTLVFVTEAGFWYKVGLGVDNVLRTGTGVAFNTAYMWEIYGGADRYSFYSEEAQTVAWVNESGSVPYEINGVVHSIYYDDELYYIRNDGQIGKIVLGLSDEIIGSIGAEIPGPLISTVEKNYWLVMEIGTCTGYVINMTDPNQPTSDSISNPPCNPLAFLVNDTTGFVITPTALEAFSFEGGIYENRDSSISFNVSGTVIEHNISEVLEFVMPEYQENFILSFARFPTAPEPLKVWVFNTEKLSTVDEVLSSTEFGDDSDSRRFMLYSDVTVTNLLFFRSFSGEFYYDLFEIRDRNDGPQEPDSTSNPTGCLNPVCSSCEAGQAGLNCKSNESGVDIFQFINCVSPVEGKNRVYFGYASSLAPVEVDAGYLIIDGEERVAPDVSLVRPLQHFAFTVDCVTSVSWYLSNSKITLSEDYFSSLLCPGTNQLFMIINGMSSSNPLDETQLSDVESVFADFLEIDVSLVVVKNIVNSKKRGTESVELLIEIDSGVLDSSEAAHILVTNTDNLSNLIGSALGETDLTLEIIAFPTGFEDLVLSENLPDFDTTSVEDSTSIVDNVKPPFYEAEWFIILVVLLAAGLVIGVVVTIIAVSCSKNDSI